MPAARNKDKESYCAGTRRGRSPVDNKTALENVKRFAGKNKHRITAIQIDDYYQLTLKK